MNPVTDDLNHPAMKAIIECANQEHDVILEWPDGGKVLVSFDTFLPSDETEDGSEECIVDVLKVFNQATSVTGFQEGKLMVVTTHNPPTKVASPNGTREWNST
jgi:hypothetical protein